MNKTFGGKTTKRLIRDLYKSPSNPHNYLFFDKIS